MKNCDEIWYADTVYTRKKMPERELNLKKEQEVLPVGYDATTNITSVIKEYAAEIEADICGIASAERIASFAQQLRPHYEDEKSLKATDKSLRFNPWSPEISEESKHVFTAQDYLPDAKSVIVIGLRFHK
jgi:hypothetical protein